MKMREVKRLFAMLLAVAMVLVMMPASGITVLAGFLDGYAPHGTGWKFESLTMTADPATIKVNNSTTVTIKASGIATVSNATPTQLATPSDVKTAFSKLAISDIEVSGNGEAEVTGITLNDAGAVLTVVGKKAGTVTLALAGTDASCQITVEEAREPKIIGIVVDPKEITIDLSESNKKQITVTAKVDADGPLTVAQSNMLIDELVKCVDQAAVEDETVADIPGSMSFQYNADTADVAAVVDVEGYRAGKTTLTFTLNEVTESCTVTVTRPEEEGPMVYEETGRQGVDRDVRQELLNTGVDENVVNEIMSSLSSEEVKVSDPAVDNVLKERYPDASTIQVIPGIMITDLEAEAVDGQINIKSISADLGVDIKVDGQWQSGDLETIFGRKLAVSLCVHVLSSEFRSGNYVQWQHYTDKEMTIEDSSVIVDSVTPISDDNTATVEAYSFSPFKLTFVDSDNDPIIPSGGSGYSGGSSSSGAASGAWMQAADGIRWWYRNPDGTWPASGWAQLIWNGRTDWYYFDANGYMVTGWVTDGGLKYYMHPVSDGTQGHMYTGWHQIDGIWYYFSDVSDGTRGHLLVNTTTPDGYSVNADGSWVH